MDYIASEIEIALFVRQQYTDITSPRYPYHNLAHTESVVRHASRIAAFYFLNDYDGFVLKAACWFHDTGHLKCILAGHEKAGVQIMKDYFSNSSVSAEMIAGIEKCILATTDGAKPVSLLEKIICDADTWHFGTPQFRQTDVLVKEEMETRTGKIFPDWKEKSLSLLTHHIFHTEYCRQLLEKGKRENIEWLKKK